MTNQLTHEEIDMIRYALNEVANRRTEQAIDRKDRSLSVEAVKHRRLALKITKLYEPKPTPTT